jgi:CTP:phosphocholine cytidylyltransferase-like protein
MTLIVFLLASFISLQVRIDEKYISIKFGYGIFNKKFSLDDILSAKTVKNHRYYGWGIRVWFWPKMWIFNVSGFDAVEIKMKNDKIYRIGSDEPKKLEQAILKAMR